MDPIEMMISELKAVAGIYEVHHKRSFRCFRTDKNGDPQEVFVDIYDQGPAVKNRYSCKATTIDGKRATGNAAPRIDQALFGVHWQELEL